jgi:hypothetical protein
VCGECGWQLETHTISKIHYLDYDANKEEKNVFVLILKIIAK